MTDLLQNQIDNKRREISTDSYSMSIGELTNLYRDSELDVHPEFQRVFRWSDQQKSNLIESILLGIPLPSIFVAQTEDGTWDVVDGVQRISTLLELQGLLVDERGHEYPPLVLKGTEYLPELEGKQWNSTDERYALTQSQRLDIKRSKIDLQIIKRDSSANAKYDLFQRLNAFGTALTAQEVRSCLLLSVDREFYSWLSTLRTHDSFVEACSLTDRLVEEQYDLELALRFIIFRDIPEDVINSMGYVGEFVTKESVELASSEVSLDEIGEKFCATFDLLASAASDQIFKKYDPESGRFKGAFQHTAFEIVGLGLGYHVDDYMGCSSSLVQQRVIDFWSSGALERGFATGKRADERMRKTIPQGRELFTRS
ncbi:DUF262 domain-containing protein [Saccharomonospora halophila]|uniref:DUF262 domain-containing protein n=1 Tax=Saccharomonospora halophila TaxID=129922 RepID=UPI000A063AC2|nr:DUF262 domain-containing protein [Saccharomonospora halophila]